MSITLKCIKVSVQTEYADDFGLGPVIGLVKSLPKGNFSVFIDNYSNSIPSTKYLKQKNIGCTGTVKANMSQDCVLYPLKVNLRSNQKGVIKVIMSKIMMQK